MKNTPNVGSIQSRWLKLLSSERLAWPRSNHVQSFRSQFQRDYDRITFTSAFRRLQDKTQVFPLAQSDYVRTRLTHTLEVSCVARNMGSLLGGWLGENKYLPSVNSASDVGDICAAASLAHDLGNPPFGHCGENAIQEWFRTSSVADIIKGNLSESEILDIDQYEGNAHAFRLATRLMMPDSSSGLQLTMATLGALVKYPIQSHPVKIKFKNRVSAKKYNFFQSELSLFKSVASALDLPVHDASEHWWGRHPLAFITEAADDITYRIVDFEDGCRLGIVSFDEARTAFGALIKDKKRFSYGDKIAYEKERVEYWRSVALAQLADECIGVFKANHEYILTGDFDVPLLDFIPSAKELEVIKVVTKKRIYKDRRVLEVEAAGYEVIYHLLEIFTEALLDVYEKGEKASGYHRKLAELIPVQCIKPRGKSIKGHYHLMMVMTDHIAGMTDSYAVSLYRKIMGIQMPN